MRGAGGEHLDEVSGQRGGGGVVENQCRRQCQAGLLGQGIAQFEGGQGISTEVFESAFGIETRRVRMGQHRGRSGVDQHGEGLQSLFRSLAGQLPRARRTAAVA